MYVTGKAGFIARRKGLKKDGSEWFSLKFFDDQADDIIVAFVDEKMYSAFENVAKRTTVSLTLSLVPGQKYFTIEDFEIADKG